MKRSGSRSMKLWVTIFVSGVGISSIGDFIYLVAINVFVLDQTHSATAVAGLWVVSRVAALFVGPWAGSITDRFSRRGQLLLVELARALLIGLLPLLSHLFSIYVVLFLLGIFKTFFDSLFLPYQTQLIPEASRKRVNAIVSTLRYSAFITGPAIAGALLIRGSVRLPLWLDAGSFLVSALSFLLLPSFHPVKRERREPQHPWRVVLTDWRDALSFLKKERLFTAIFVLNAAIDLFSLTADTQEVVFAREALKLGQFGFGLMVTSAGVGLVLGSLILSVWARRLSVVVLLGGGTALKAIGYLIYACSSSLLSAILGLIVLGVFGALSGVGLSTYIQKIMPVSHMGRINSVVGPPQQLLSILFILLGGVWATFLGVRSLMQVMAGLMTVAGILLMIMVIRNKKEVLQVDLEEKA